MIIVITNQKGGVSKSLLAREIATNLNLKLIDCDPYGNQNITLIDESVKVIKMNPEQEEIEIIDDSVYDLGGFDYSEFAPDLIRAADVIIIPTLPSFSNLDNVVKTYNKLLNVSSETDQKITFVVSRYFLEEDVNDVKKYLAENINIDDKEIFSIRNSRGLQSAENAGISIIKLANENPLNKRSYRKICNELNKIFEYIKG